MASYPDNWRTTRLTTFLKKVRRPVAMELQTLYHQIGVRSFGKGIFHKEPVTGEDLGGKEVFWVRPGDFVLNIVFAWEGAVALISAAEEGMCASHRFPAFIINDTMCDPAFLLLYFKTKKGVEQLALASPGGAGRNRTLNQSDFLNLIIALPPLPEQRKIAGILSTWNQAIGAVQQLIVALQERKRGLMRRLLTRQVGFPEFEGCQWEEVRLGDVLNIQYGKSPLGIRNENGRYTIWGTGGSVGRTNETLCDSTAVIIGRKGTIDRPQLVRQPFWAIDTTFFCTTRNGLDISWIYQF